MSNVSLKKPFKHFATNALFYAAKVSVNAENTAYIQNGEIHTGTPDILWEHTVFIHDVAQIWNRGRYYNSQKYLGKLAAISKNAFMEYSGMPIVTFVDVKPETLYNNVSLFQNYPGILPSIVVAPGTVQDINKILGLANKGSDVLSTSFNGTSVYDATKDKDYNYDNFLDDMTAVEQWLTEHGLFTNCYKYPDASVAATESEFIQRYEEYGLAQANTAANGLKQDNMLLNGKLVNSNEGVTEAISEINAATGTTWLIYLIDTTSITSLDTLIEAVQQGIDDGHCIYMQMHEGLQMRASEFNIGRSENTLPFRVYKDGSVDANLTASSVEAITETVAAEIAQQLPGEGLTYNTTTGKLDWDSSVLDNYVEKVEGKGLSTNDFTDAYMSKLDGIAAGAEVNVQSDWNVTDTASDSYINNKPGVDTTVTYGSSNLITSGGAYTALAETERTVSAALAEFKTTYLDTLDSPERMQKFMYYMAANLLSYWNANGVSFILQG